MRVHLEGIGSFTLTDWAISEGMVEVPDCDDPDCVRREGDGTFTITGRIVPLAEPQAALTEEQLRKQLKNSEARYG